MTSFFRRSFKRPTAFDLGNTHLMMSIQSLSVIIVGAFSCLRSACRAATRSFARLCNLLCDVDAALFASRARCSVCALKTTLAFPILVPHTTFQSAPVENEPFVSTSILT